MHFHSGFPQAVDQRALRSEHDDRTEAAAVEALDEGFELPVRTVTAGGGVEEEDGRYRRCSVPSGHAGGR